MNTVAADQVDNTVNDPTRPTPLVLGGHDLTSLTDHVCGIVEKPKPPRAWYIGTLSRAIFWLRQPVQSSC